MTEETGNVWPGHINIRRTTAAAFKYLQNCLCSPRNHSLKKRYHRITFHVNVRKPLPYRLHTPFKNNKQQFLSQAIYAKLKLFDLLGRLDGRNANVSFKAVWDCVFRSQPRKKGTKNRLLPNPQQDNINIICSINVC